MRTGEILEVVPGLIVTQHSGTGKSNQMFLRGFNLDHGTDFATWVDGMPVNLPTHGHGQGYTDVNFLIPELVERLEYRKGGYYAEVIGLLVRGRRVPSTYEHLPEGMIKAGVGETATCARSRPIASRRVGQLLYGVQAHRYDGPWADIDEDVKRNNLLLRYIGSHRRRRLERRADGLRREWNSADQIPRRAVESGSISRSARIDTTLGGDTSRYSLSGSWARGRRVAAACARTRTRSTTTWSCSPTSRISSTTRSTAISSRSATTHDHGRRVAIRDARLGNDKRMRHTFGAMLRNDDIGGVGLFHTAQRRRARHDSQRQRRRAELGLYYSNETRWSDKFRTTLGIRADRFDFDVASDLRRELGLRERVDVSAEGEPDLLGPTDETELYLSAGKGFHSNDARGTTITVDPVTATRRTR